MWEDFALKGHGLSGGEEIFQESPWPLEPEGWGWAGKLHPSAAKAEAILGISIGTAQAVPFQSRCSSRFRIQMRLPWLKAADSRQQTVFLPMLRIGQIADKLDSAIPAKGPGLKPNSIKGLYSGG